MTFKLRIRRIKSAGHEKMGNPRVQCLQHRKQVLVWRRIGRSMVEKSLPTRKGMTRWDFLGQERTSVFALSAMEKCLGGRREAHARE